MDKGKISLDKFPKISKHISKNLIKPLILLNLCLSNILYVQNH